MTNHTSQRLDLLAFGPHPDDVELGCGGMLAKMVRLGHSVGIVDLTRGELGTRGTPELRKKEADAAAEVMGITIRENLALPDGNIPESVPVSVIETIRRYRPSIVLIPYREDRHPDHVRTSRLITEACFISGLEKIETDLEAYQPRWMLYYMQHFEFPPAFVVDISDDFQKKMKAIRAYQSQTYNPPYQERKKEKETLISSQNFLKYIETRARYYGSLIGASLGEPFWMNTMIGVDDPVEFFAS